MAAALRSNSALIRARVHLAPPFCPALLLAWLCNSAAIAQDAAAAAVPERMVKAAFLYKFASYVRWPEDVAGAVGDPIWIGVYTASEFAQELAEITQGRTVSDRPINVRRLTNGDDLGNLDELDILFIAQDQRGRLPELLASVRGLPILTVTESEGALSEGSIINFAVDDQRVRFDVSLYAAGQSRLRLNSRLLAVAREVYRAPE